MSKQIQAKEGNGQALRYNCWTPIRFGAGVPAGANLFAPLGLNHKFMMLSYCLTGASITAGISFSVNVRSGIVTTNPVYNTSYGYFDLAGTYIPNDQITLNLAGVLYKFSVTTRNGASNTTLAASIAASLNANVAFNVGYIANSLGAEVVIQPLTYAAVTPAYSVSTTSTAGNGTITAGGATFVAATGSGTLPTMAPGDNSSYQGRPSIVASPGNTLFPVDIILPTFSTAQAGLTGSVYASAGYDSIFPANSAVTLTIANPTGEQTDAAIFTLMGVPIDNHDYLPATLPKGFAVNSEIL